MNWLNSDKERQGPRLFIRFWEYTKTTFCIDIFKNMKISIIWKFRLYEIFVLILWFMVTKFVQKVTPYKRSPKRIIYGHWCYITKFVQKVTISMTIDVTTVWRTTTLRVQGRQKEKQGSTGIWTRDLLHPKQEWYLYTIEPLFFWEVL